MVPPPLMIQAKALSYPRPDRRQVLTFTLDVRQSLLATVWDFTGLRNKTCPGLKDSTSQRNKRVNKTEITSSRPLANTVVKPCTILLVVSGKLVSFQLLGPPRAICTAGNRQWAKCGHQVPVIDWI
jgi:hypothetical protein